MSVAHRKDKSSDSNRSPLQTYYVKHTVLSIILARTHRITVQQLRLKLIPWQHPNIGLLQPYQEMRNLKIRE